MIESATEAPLTALPTVARLGFDDGWLLLNPTFLNLQKPVLLVDQIHTGPHAGLGLEPFGSRDPRSSLPACRIRLVVAGSGVSLWTTLGEHAGLLATHWFEAHDAPTTCCGSTELILFVGDTYAVEMSWSALWTCSIGKARIDRAYGGAVSAAPPTNITRTGLTGSLRSITT